jgi:hypothetical protein
VSKNSIVKKMLYIKQINNNKLLPVILVTILTLSFVIIPLRSTFPFNGNELGISHQHTKDNNNPLPRNYENDDENNIEKSPTITLLPTPPPPAPFFSQSLANSQILALKSDPQYGLGPLVVGGIGDSGTRAVREVLRLFGVQMLAHSKVNIPGDSEIFQAAYPLVDSHHTIHHLMAVDLYTPAVKHAKKIDYSEIDSLGKEDQWQLGRQFIALQTYTSMNYSRLQRIHGKPLGLWGFKHPRTSLMLPFFEAALGNDGFRFLHVLRDPKEVVFGNNQQVFDSLCDLYYGHICEKGPGKKLEFWVDLNHDILRFVKSNRLLASRYLPIRIEDLVLKRQQCYQKLGEFTGLSPQQSNRLYRDAINVTRGHEHSYFGHTINAEERKLVYDALKIAKESTKKGIESWGFSISSFKLEYDCEKLPFW